MKVNYMSGDNPKYWLWFDIKAGKYWYVFQWIKGHRPFLYRSLDGTPPDSAHENDGKMLIGAFSE